MDKELEELVGWIADKATDFADRAPVTTLPVAEIRQNILALITKEKNKLLNELIEEANTYIIAINQSDDYEVTERATPIDSIKRRIE
jgi:hypothetical protein